MREDVRATSKLGSEFSPSYSELPPREIFLEAAASTFSPHAAAADAALNTTSAAGEPSSVPRSFGTYETNNKKAKIFTFEGLTPASTQDDTRQDTGAVLLGDEVLAVDGSISARDPDALIPEEVCSLLTIDSDCYEAPSSTFRQKLAAWERYTLTWKAREVYEVPFDEDPMTVADCNSPRSNVNRLKKDTTPKAPLRIEPTTTTTDSVANTPIDGKEISTVMTSASMGKNASNFETEVIDLCHHSDDDDMVPVETTFLSENASSVVDESATNKAETSLDVAHVASERCTVYQDEEKCPETNVECEALVHEAALITPESMCASPEQEEAAIEQTISPTEGGTSHSMQTDNDATVKAAITADRVAAVTHTGAPAEPTTCTKGSASYEDAVYKIPIESYLSESEMKVEDLTKVDKRYDQLGGELSPINEEEATSDDDETGKGISSSGIEGGMETSTDFAATEKPMTNDSELSSDFASDEKAGDDVISSETFQGLTSESSVAPYETKHPRDSCKVDDAPHSYSTNRFSVEAEELAVAVEPVASGRASLLDHEDEDDEVATAVTEEARIVNTAPSDEQINSNEQVIRRLNLEPSVGCSDDLCNQVSKFLALN